MPGYRSDLADFSMFVGLDARISMSNPVLGHPISLFNGEHEETLQTPIRCDRRKKNFRSTNSRSRSTGKWHFSCFTQGWRRYAICHFFRKLKSSICDDADRRPISLFNGEHEETLQTPIGCDRRKKDFSRSDLYPGIQTRFTRVWMPGYTSDLADFSMSEGLDARI